MTKSTLRWLVTGAPGLLGRAAGAVLPAPLATSRSGVCPKGYSHALRSDLSVPGSVARVIEDVRPDVILNAAAIASHDACNGNPQVARRINAAGAAEVARAANSVGARLIHVSTDAVFDGEKGNYSESDTVNPFSVYGESKALGEELVARANPAALIVRVNFFGWSASGQRSILEYFISRISKSECAVGYTNVETTSAYSIDLVRALRELANSKLRGVVHVSTPDSLTKFQFGQLCAVELRADPELVLPACRILERNQPYRNLSLDSSLAYSALGHSLANQAMGVKSALAVRTPRC